MIKLQFFNLQPPAAVDVDGEEFLFAGDEVFRLPQRQLVAQHRDNQWIVGTELYMRLQVEQHVECRCEGHNQSEERHGPFSHVAGIDGVLIVDGKPFAMIRGKHWSSMESSRPWARLRLCSPA